MNARITPNDVREAGQTITPCAECGHLHAVAGPPNFLVVGWIACPIEDCDCKGQNDA
jgi:hypothetical protein